MNIAIWSEFPHGSRDDIENSILPFSIGLQHFFFNWSYKIRNLNLCSKKNEHCNLYRISPRSKKEIKNLIPPFSVGIQDFSSSLNSRIFEHCQIVQNFPLVPEMIFFKSFPWIFKGPFLHCKTYSPKYWTRLSSIGQYVSRSVRQSVMSVRQSEFAILFLNRPPGSGLVIECP